MHSAGPKDLPFRKHTWIKANPSVKHNPILEATYRKEASKARRDPELLANFKALRLNMGVSDTVESFLIDSDLWKESCGLVDSRGSCYWGT